MGLTFDIGLSAWIIQDGNYEDFEQGQTRSFALEFYPEKPFQIVDPVPQADRVILWREDSIYEAQGTVLLSNPIWSVIDVGVLCFIENPDDYFTAGVGIVGGIYLGIDPFFYMANLSRITDAPALIYDWRIEDILIETAPLVETKPHYYERDKSKLGRKSIPRTDAWRDDDGSGDYILRCTLFDTPPRRSL
jgi:hypothetical protein